MAFIKMNKHQVYSYIANHPEWFKRKFGVSEYGEEQYLPCSAIEYKINEILLKSADDILKSDYIILRGATLTAMVHDGVLVRKHSDYAHCYEYLPVQPIKEEYKSA